MSANLRNVCPRCHKKFYLAVLVDSDCDACGHRIVNSGVPAKYCDECSVDEERCSICGEGMKGGEDEMRKSGS